MEEKISYACVRYEDDKLKNHVAYIDDIFHDSKLHRPFNPKHENDFTNHVYHIYFRSCVKKQCKPRDNCCNSYKGYIISLGCKY